MQDNNIMVIKFADAKVPEFKELPSKDWLYYGEKDDFPEYLLMLYNKSAKHGAIINNKVTYVYGGGLESVAPNPAADEFLRVANPEQSWNELIKQTAKDVELFGGFYWQVIPNMLGREYVYLMPFSKVRVSKDGKWYFFKNNWKDRNEEMKKFPAYVRNSPVPSIFCFKEYRPSSDNRYPLPGYMHACNYIESDVEVSRHTLTNAKTGFSASKFINFYNGQPTEEGKRAIQRRFEDSFTGSEGKKIVVGFNDDPNKKPTVDDLGASDLTKEDFSVVDGLISQNIYAGHQVTSPILFGIKEEGQLGATTELRAAYEIFVNTYAKEKQQTLVDIVQYFSENNGVKAELRFVPVEPIGFEVTEQMVLQAAPKSWLLDKMGIDATKYTDGPVEVKSPASAAPAAPVGQEGMVNEHLKNLTGRQFQQIDRIKRKYKSGQLSREEAAMLLKNSFGMSDDDINVMLGDAQQFDSDFDDTELVTAFETFGDTREGYEIIRSKSYKFDSDEEDAEVAEMFKDASGSSGSLLDRIVKTMPKFVIRYSYEKRKDAQGATLLPTSREFCKYMVNRDRLYSREDIQKISEALGYNVFKRTGGFWNKNGKIVPHCRHEWRSNIVIKKVMK